MAITNILIQTNKDLIFYKKLSILSILQENCKFEVDPQMNLRLLYLLNISLGKKQLMSKMPPGTQGRSPQLKAKGGQNDINLNESAVGDDENQGDLRKKITEGPAAGKAYQEQKNTEINQQNKEIQSQATVSLVNFLLENIFKFKSIIQYQSFSVEIPKIDPALLNE